MRCSGETTRVMGTMARTAAEDCTGYGYGRACGVRAKRVWAMARSCAEQRKQRRGKRKRRRQREWQGEGGPGVGIHTLQLPRGPAGKEPSGRDDWRPGTRRTNAASGIQDPACVQTAYGQLQRCYSAQHTVDRSLLAPGSRELLRASREDRAGGGEGEDGARGHVGCDAGRRTKAGVRGGKSADPTRTADAAKEDGTGEREALRRPGGRNEDARLFSWARWSERRSPGAPLACQEHAPEQ